MWDGPFRDKRAAFASPVLEPASTRGLGQGRGVDSRGAGVGYPLREQA